MNYISIKLSLKKYIISLLQSHLLLLSLMLNLLWPHWPHSDFHFASGPLYCLPAWNILSPDNYIAHSPQVPFLRRPALTTQVVKPSITDILNPVPSLFNKLYHWSLSNRYIDR